MKPITERKALIECRKTWQWCADNPDKDKVTYFNSVSALTKYPGRPCVDCWACEYVKKNHPTRDIGIYIDVGVPNTACITVCPLRAIWPDGCEAQGTPYDTWRNTSAYDNNQESLATRRTAALAIVRGCTQALARLKRKRKCRR